MRITRWNYEFFVTYARGLIELHIFQCDKNKTLLTHLQQWAGNTCVCALQER